MRSPTPEAILDCLPGLAEAAGCLGAVEQELRAGVEPPEIGLELQALRCDLGTLKRLIAQGEAFHRGWAKVLGAATSGYMPSGEAAPVSAIGAISIQG